jgi:hypothetical protein
MKKTLILLLFTLTLFSCSDPGGDPVFDGFEFDFRNKTNQEYTIEIVIGGMQNGTFVPTDSILMPSELIANKNISFYTEENRWKPNLNKIKAIPSERCYFKIKLSPQREEVIIKSGQSDALGLLLPSSNFFAGDYGRLIIGIWDNEVTGYTPKEL